MKKITFISAAVLCIVAAFSCTTEVFVQDSIRRTTIEANIASTKTAFGEKDGTAWPNYWKAGDQISVNGVTSNAVDSESDGKASTTFTFESELATPYYAAYPAAAVSGYENGCATVTMPAAQSYVEGSYDPAALFMGGVSKEAGSVTLAPCVGVIRLSMSGEASISRIKLTGAEETALSGTFTTNFSSISPADVSNVVELVAETPVALPADFFICVPAGLSGALKIEAFDNAGGSMSKTASITSPLVPGKVFPTPDLPYVASGNVTITAEGITSSTAIICWDNAPAAAYTVGVYSDSGCTSLLNSYAVPAGDKCWGGNSPRFCISGLAAGETYYVKVTNVTFSTDSNILPVTMAAFKNVEVSSTPAEVDDVILAEDFGELRWDSELITGGAGYFATSQNSFANAEVAEFLPIDTNSEKLLSNQGDALASSRLAHWAQGAKANLYIHPGYIKLSASKAITHLVTPALDNIPDGKLATLEVEVTACPYFSESGNAYDTFDAVVAVQPAGSYNELTDETKTNTLNLTTNIQPVTLAAETAWKSYKVTLNGVGKGARLAFGAASSSAKGRMNVSDIKVTVKALEELSLKASVKSVSSSTAAFTWTYGVSAAEDIAKPYTIALYSDENCEDLVVSFDFAAESACWNGKTPCFVFGGLKPATDYWFVATDTESARSSKPVSVTTEAFTVVVPSDVTDPQVGDILLAEDFSEIGAGPDEIAKSAGFVPSSKVLPVVPSGDNPDGSYVIDLVGYDPYGDRIIGAGWDLGGSRLSNDWGFFGGSSCYYGAGYLRLSTSSGRTHIVTPALSGIPAGKIATVEVTVTAAKYESSTNDIAVFAEKGLTMDPQTDAGNSSYRKYTGASLSDGHALGITAVKSWETKSVTISKVESDHQLLIGSLVDAKNRCYISDVVVSLVSLKDKGAIDAVVEINDFASFKEFLTACGPGKTIQGNVNADIELTSEQAEEIDALYPVVEFDGIVNGNNHTISGLIKPLFAKLEGTVSNLTLNSTLNIAEAMNNVGIFAQSASNAALTGCISMGSVTSSASEVSGDLALGGMVGSISGCTLTACQNHATVTNNSTASGIACVGGLIGVADGANTLTGTANVYNYNQGLIIEDSATLNVAVGGVCGYSDGAPSSFDYSKSLAPDSETDYDDIEIRDNTKNKVYVGGIIGKSSTTSSMDYTYNSSDIKFTSLKITQSGQVFGGGIIGGWSESGEQIITGCENKGWVYTKASAGDLAVADSDNKPKYWSCFAGIAGMGAGTSESLSGGWNTITGKTFTNCTNTGTVRIYAALRCCIAGVVAYTENNPDGCVSTAADIRPYLTGGISQVGDNYHRNICGGVVGLCTASKVSNLKSTAKIVSQSSSPFAYTGGIIGYVPAGTIELEYCKVSNHVQATGSGDGRSALMCHAAQNNVTVTFTNCVVKKGTISYATGSKVSISSSNISAQHCVGSGSKRTVVNDVLPTVEDSID